jgi:hypothetical protein
MARAPDGRWGVLGGVVPGFGNVQFVAGSEETIELFRELAIRHHEATGHPVRLVRFTTPEIMSQIGAARQQETGDGFRVPRLRDGEPPSRG